MKIYKNCESSESKTRTFKLAAGGENFESQRNRNADSLKTNKKTKKQKEVDKSTKKGDKWYNGSKPLLSYDRKIWKLPF